MVFDEQFDREAGLLWTPTHSKQGFARRQSSASFLTLAQFGYADLVVGASLFASKSDYIRAISVPFYTPSGRVLIEGPDEVRIGRIVVIGAGYYRLTAAQRLVERALYQDEEDTIAIDLYLEMVETPLLKSEIVISDQGLAPSGLLVEDADVATY